MQWQGNKRTWHPKKEHSEWLKYCRKCSVKRTRYVSMSQTQPRKAALLHTFHPLTSRPPGSRWGETLKGLSTQIKQWSHSLWPLTETSVWVITNLFLGPDISACASRGVTSQVLDHLGFLGFHCKWNFFLDESQKFSCCSLTSLSFVTAKYCLIQCAAFYKLQAFILN